MDNEFKSIDKAHFGLIFFGIIASITTWCLLTSMNLTPTQQNIINFLIPIMGIIFVISYLTIGCGNTKIKPMYKHYWE